MKKSIIFIVAFVSLVLAIPQSVAAVQVGAYEFYGDANDRVDCYSRCGNDLWYVPGQSGVTYNPIIVEMTAHDYYASGGWWGSCHFIPSWMTVEVIVTNEETVRQGIYPSYMHLGGYHITTSSGGETITWGGSAGLSGTVGDDTYSIGANIDISWTITGCTLYNKDLDIYEHNVVTPREGRYLGSLMVDSYTYSTTTYVDYGITLYLAPSNTLSPTFGPYDRHSVHLVITVHWCAYQDHWPYWFASDNMASLSFITTLGNQPRQVGVTDTLLYLIPAQSYTPTISPST